MEIAMIGLGKMGGSMARRLARKGHNVVVFNRTIDKASALQKEEKNISVAATLEELAHRLSPPRSCWLMIPGGDAVDEMIGSLVSVLAPGDIIIDGGDSHYKDTLKRAGDLVQGGFRFVDVGISGGAWGLADGFSMTIGGEEDTVNRLRSIFETLAPAPTRGWGHVGPAGAGHYVKMVHNRIEDRLMKAYAEGLGMIKDKQDLGLDLCRIAKIWQHGSNIRSGVLDYLEATLSEKLEGSGLNEGKADSGGLLVEGDCYAAKLLVFMRRHFGCHDAIEPDGERHESAC